MITKDSIFKIFCYILLIIPFFIPDILNYLFSQIATVLRIAQIIVLIIFLFFMKGKKISSILKYIILYTLFLTFITILKNGNIYYNLKDSLSFLGLCLICDHFVRKDPYNFLKSLYIYLGILNIVNFICIALFPNGMYINSVGMYTNWFLGYKNSHILYIYPWIMCMIINSYNKNKKISLMIYLCTIVSLFFMIKINSSTSIVCLMLLLLISMFYTLLNKLKFISAKKLLLLALILFALIVIFRIQNIFSYLIVKTLGKTITFTGRTLIWDQALLGIKQSLLFGHGDGSFVYNLIIFSCHNQFLGIAFESGLIGLSIFSLIIFQLCKVLDNTKYQNKLITLIKYFVFIYLIIMLMEEYNMRYYMYMFVILFNIVNNNSLNQEMMDVKK